MEVDAPAVSPADAARALALQLHEAGEALQAAQDAARELLDTQPLPPLEVDTETILAYARFVSRVRPARSDGAWRAMRGCAARIAAACAPGAASQAGVQGLALQR